MEPERFGLMLVGDFIDAMSGFNENEKDRFKNFAEVIRTSTAMLWNIQVGIDDKMDPEDLWPFSWDKNKKGEEISDQEYIRRKEESKKWMEKNMRNGSGNQ